MGDRFDLTEADRRISNLVRYGTVEEADYEKAKVKIKCGDQVTGWIPWMMQRSGKYRNWDPPEVGEQVVMLAPDGDPSQGVMLGAVSQDSSPPAGESVDVRRTDYGDGTVAEYDRNSKVMSITCEGDLNITCKGNITVKANHIDLN